VLPVMTRRLWFVPVPLTLLLSACGTASPHKTTEGAGPGRSTISLLGSRAHLREVVLRNNESLVRLDFPAGELAAAGPSDILPIMAYRKLCSVGHGDDFGLNKPSVSLSADTPARAPSHITFGNRNFTGAGVYTSIAGDPCVYLTPVTQVERVAALVDDQRAQVLYGPAGPPVSKLLDEQNQKENAESEDNPWVVQSQHAFETGER
jgi:hypothetical protein